MLESATVDKGSQRFEPEDAKLKALACESTLSLTKCMASVKRMQSLFNIEI